MWSSDTHWRVKLHQIHKAQLYPSDPQPSWIDFNICRNLTAENCSKALILLTFFIIQILFLNVNNESKPVSEVLQTSTQTLLTFICPHLLVHEGTCSVLTTSQQRHPVDRQVKTPKWLLNSSTNIKHSYMTCILIRSWFYIIVFKGITT